MSESDTEFRIMMPTATVVLTPSEQQLTARIESELEDHTRLEGVVIDHLNRMAQQEFNVTWSQV